MKIAVSADCFDAYTSGFPVRGMMLHLVQIRHRDKFVFFYSKKAKNPALKSFYDKINHLPNVELIYLNQNPKLITLQNLFTFSAISLDETFDFFINPGHLEFIRNFNKPQIAPVADLSTIKGYSTAKNAAFFKWQGKFSKPYFFRNLTKIVAISQATKSDVISTFGCDSSKIEVIYNGVDPFWFDDIYEENQLTQSLQNENYFIWWGNISQRKNVERLIQAYILAKKENTALPRLLLVGNFQPEMAFLKEFLSENIIHQSFQPDYVLKTLVKNSKGLLFPSLYEGFGMPVLEAFSQKVPVLHSNSTSLPEAANEMGIAVDPLNLSDIKAGILKLNQTFFDSEKAKQYASTFTYANCAAHYSKLINTLA